MSKWAEIPLVAALGAMLEEKDKRERAEEEGQIKGNITVLPREKIVEALKKLPLPDSLCTSEATVICSNAADESEEVHIVANSEVYLGGKRLLTRTDVQPENNFSGCIKAKDGRCRIAENYRDWILDDEWKAYDSSSGQGVGKEMLSREYSYMLCEEYCGVIHFLDDGQLSSSSIDKYLESYEKERVSGELLFYYENNKCLIAEIDSVNADGRFSYDINNFIKIYEENKVIYENISGRTGVPPELIAAIHYRESAGDFNTYLHNGQKLGSPTTTVPKGRIFYDFSEAAVDALISTQERRGIKLTKYDSVVMMATFAEVFNGTGYTNYRDIPSPYVYSGTDIYVSGKYVSDNTYNSDVVDQQPGVYLLITVIREGENKNDN